MTASSPRTFQTFAEALTDSGGLAGAAVRAQSRIAAGPIVPNVNADEIRNYLGSRYDFKSSIPLNEVAADVEHMLQRWQVQVTHPRYFGLFNPSVTTPSIVADALTATYNPQLATWRTSPGPNEIERHTLAWLTGKFGLPANSSATFTSGGAEANLSAVIAALTRTFPHYGEDGVRSISAVPAVYLSREAHHSFNKIAHMTGLGRHALRTVSVGRDLKMDLSVLKARIAEDRKNGFAPFMVVGTAGTTAAAAIDPLPELAAYCKGEGLWFHVDAAWGGAAIVSPKLRPLLAGIESADSITCDAHKWFSVPMGAGMFFCRHPETIKETFHAETSYMPPKTPEEVTDPYTTSVQWSRRFIGLKLFLSLANYGESGYASLIEHQARMGDILRESLVSTGWRIVNSTPLPLVCFTREGLNVSHFLSELYRRQIAWMSEVRLDDGAPVLRACITSFRTTEAEVRWAVSEMNGIGLSAA